MLYRKFGKTNEMVSILGFGCMRLPLLSGGDPARIDEKLALRLIRYAIDEGVTYIDTAYPYHGPGREKSGQSEPFVAKALKDGYRKKVKLATKLPSWLVKTRQDMDRYLNEQLKRLETDFIDFYLIHNLNTHVWPMLAKIGLAEFLDSALKDGRIKYAGFSFHDKTSLFKEIVDYYDWSFCQIQYNYLDESFQAGKAGLKYAAQKDLGIAVMEPLKGGKLANNLPEAAQRIFDQAEAKRTPADWALRWVLNHPEVSVALSGMNAMDQVTGNLKTASETQANSLSANEIEALDQVKRIFKKRIKVDCTTCGYCMPCPAGVDIPTCFTMYNNYHMFGSEDGYNRWLAPQQRASMCTECGTCETHCPQGISVRRELKNVCALFE